MLLAKSLILVDIAFPSSGFKYSKSGPRFIITMLYQCELIITTEVLFSLFTQPGRRDWASTFENTSISRSSKEKPRTFTSNGAKIQNHQFLSIFGKRGPGNKNRLNNRPANRCDAIRIKVIRLMNRSMTRQLCHSSVLSPRS